MAIKHQYILDAIQKDGLSARVEVLVDNVPTTISASIALAEILKPEFKRRKAFKKIAPIVHEIKDAVVAVIDAVFEEKDADEAQSEEISKKKKKKQNDEVDES